MNTFGIEAFAFAIFIDIADSVALGAVHWFDFGVEFVVFRAIVQHFADAVIAGAFFGSAFGMVVIDFDAYFAFGGAVGGRSRRFIARFEAFIEIIRLAVAIGTSGSARVGMVMFLANLFF